MNSRGPDAASKCQELFSIYPNLPKLSHKRLDKALKQAKLKKVLDSALSGVV